MYKYTYIFIWNIIQPLKRRKSCHLQQHSEMDSIMRSEVSRTKKGNIARYHFGVESRKEGRKKGGSEGNGLSMLQNFIIIKTILK